MLCWPSNWHQSFFLMIDVETLDDPAAECLTDKLA
jgi:hypothetical protein